MLQPLPTTIADIAHHSWHFHAEPIDATSENLTYQSLQPLVHKMRLSLHLWAQHESAMNGEQYLLWLWEGAGAYALYIFAFFCPIFVYFVFDCLASENKCILTFFLF